MTMGSNSRRLQRRVFSLHHRQKNVLLQRRIPDFEFRQVFRRGAPARYSVCDEIPVDKTADLAERHLVGLGPCDQGAIARRKLRGPNEVKQDDVIAFREAQEFKQRLSVRVVRLDDFNYDTPPRPVFARGR